MDPVPGETIVEIGPGRGALTEPLIRSGARVIGLELDDDLADSLRFEFASATNFSVVTGDGLEIELGALIAPARQARIVANLPYNVSTKILQRLLQQSENIIDLTLMLQREVVGRISARPNEPERGFLSVLVEAHCVVEKLFDVAPTVFKPVPKVWSSVVQLMPRRTIPVDIIEALLWRLVGAGFGQRRKTMLNNLKASPELFGDLASPAVAAEVLKNAGIEPSRRAQTLSLDEWFQLCRSIQNSGVTHAS